jgi:hypothetical protein
MTALVLESSPWHRGANLAVPYPTGFHQETAADVAARQEKARNAERGWLFSFVGSPWPGSEKTARAEIIRQCGASRRCTKPSASAPSSCESSPRTVMRLMESSTFCLQPSGDTPTRRSTFDAVLAGCVPVFFHPRRTSSTRDTSSVIPPSKGENGAKRKNLLIIFTHINFYSVGNENRKVRNRIRLIKSGPSKMDKFKQKCLSIDQQTVI